MRLDLRDAPLAIVDLALQALTGIT